MSAYADTGFLCSLYAPDANSAKANAKMRPESVPLWFTWIHQVELRNAMRLRVFRKEITMRQKDASLNLVLADVAQGILAASAPDHGRLVLEAERLSASYSERLGTRSLDILHVAAALVLGERTFLTFDRRQASLARAVGLHVPRP
jgi:predicted nucleic acid-binding protein